MLPHLPLRSLPSLHPNIHAREFCGSIDLDWISLLCSFDSCMPCTLLTNNAYLKGIFSVNYICNCRMPLWHAFIFTRKIQPKKNAPNGSLAGKCTSPRINVQKNAVITLLKCIRIWIYMLHWFQKIIYLPSQKNHSNLPILKESFTFPPCCFDIPGRDVT